MTQERINRFVFISLAAVILALCGRPALAAEAELIPRRDLFAPAVGAIQVSPDGRYLLYSERTETEDWNICIRDLGAGSVQKHSLKKKGISGIFNLYWTGDSRRLLVTMDEEGDENNSLGVLDIFDPKAKLQKLVTVKKVQVRLLPASQLFPDEVLLLLNRDNPQEFDLFRLHLTKRELKLEMKNPGGVIGWKVDEQLRLRAMAMTRPEGGEIIRIRDGVTGEWKTVYSSGIDENVILDRFGRDGQSVYVLHNLKTDMLSLYRLDMKSGAEELRHDPGKADITRVFYTAAGDPACLEIDHLQPEYVVLDPAWQSAFEELAKARPGRLHVLNHDLEDPIWTVLAGSDRQPRAYCTYDRRNGKIETVFSTRPDFEKYPGLPKKALSIRSRDSLDLVSYLTLPAGREPVKLPLVLVVHGGPWGERDVWDFSPVSQWLADRGYAVLEVNYRGSQGFGKRFLAAGNRQWGRKMLDDLLDARKWAVDQGIADPKKTAVFGSSYGGYAALAAAAFQSSQFTCSVDFCGPSDLTTFIRTIPPYWKPLLKMFELRVGHPETDRESLIQVSPLYQADGITIPMLIAQGRNDPRVHFLESRKIVSALRGRQREVVYLEFPDEGHGLNFLPNRLAFLAEVEVFFGRHLGGRVQPPSKDEQKVIDRVKQEK